MRPIGSEPEGWFARFGRWLHAQRWWVIGLWVVAMALCLPLAPGAVRRLQPGGFSHPNQEAQRAAGLIQRTLGSSPATLIAVYTSSTLQVSDPSFVEAVEASLAEVRGMPVVASVTTHRDNARQAAPDGHTAYAVISLSAEAEEFRRVLPEVQARLRPTELDMVLTGAPIFYADILEVTERDLRRAELISIPFAGVALVVIFGSIVAAALPALVGGAAVAATLGILSILARATDLSVFALNLVTMLGLGLGIDYSLFLVSRFREERTRSDEATALAITLSTAGRAVFFSGLTVLLGLLGLVTFEVMALRSLGVAGSLVVGFSVLAALTLLPALLAALGPRVDSLTVLRFGPGRSGFWHHFAGWVMSRALLVFLVVLVLLLALGAPFLRVELGAPDASILPRDMQSRQGADLLRERFGPGEIAPILVVVQARDTLYTAERIGALVDFTARLRADPRVARVESMVTLDPRISREQYQLLYRDPSAIPESFGRGAAAAFTRDPVTLVRVFARSGQTTEEAKGLVRSIRATSIGAGLETLIGGGSAGAVDYVDVLYSDFPRALVMIVLATYLVLLMLFRSPVLPLKAVLMNTLSILASYGALVVVFQEGAFSQVLGFQPLGFVEASLPIVLFCVLFGLSMDYEVFLLSRIREAYEESGDNSTSVAAGLERSGRIITSAALIIVLVSGSFVAADIILIKALGLGTAIAVLLDATVVRALLVPATMRLLGTWNWWVPWDKVRHSEPGEGSVASAEASGTDPSLRSG